MRRPRVGVGEVEGCGDPGPLRGGGTGRTEGSWGSGVVVRRAPARITVPGRTPGATEGGPWGKGVTAGASPPATGGGWGVEVTAGTAPGDVARVPWCSTRPRATPTSRRASTPAPRRRAGTMLRPWVSSSSARALPHTGSWQDGRTTPLASRVASVGNRVVETLAVGRRHCGEGVPESVRGGGRFMMLNPYGEGNGWAAADRRHHPPPAREDGAASGAKSVSGSSTGAPWCWSLRVEARARRIGNAGCWSDGTHLFRHEGHQQGQGRREGKWRVPLAELPGGSREEGPRECWVLG
jgi:hypothetical protein